MADTAVEHPLSMMQNASGKACRKPHTEGTGYCSLELFGRYILSLRDGGQVCCHKGANCFHDIVPLDNDIAVQIFLLRL